MTPYRTARRKAQKRCKRRRWSRCAECHNADGGNCETYVAGRLAVKRCRSCGNHSFLGGGNRQTHTLSESDGKGRKAVHVRVVPEELTGKDNP